MIITAKNKGDYMKKETMLLLLWVWIILSIVLLFIPLLGIISLIGVVVADYFLDDPLGLGKNFPFLKREKESEDKQKSPFRNKVLFREGDFSLNLQFKASDTNKKEPKKEEELTIENVQGRLEDLSEKMNQSLVDLDKTRLIVEKALSESEQEKNSIKTIFNDLRNRLSKDILNASDEHQIYGTHEKMLEDYESMILDGVKALSEELNMKREDLENLLKNVKEMMATQLNEQNKKDLVERWQINMNSLIGLNLDVIRSDIDLLQGFINKPSEISLLDWPIKHRKKFIDTAVYDALVAKAKALNEEFQKLWR